MIKDYLGSDINIGDRGIRVHSYGHSKDFKKITVKEIDSTRKYGDSIGIITDGATKIGWTYPSRIIVQSSLNIII
jgi:hypothetical protein